MKVHQDALVIETRGRGLVDITGRIAEVTRKAGIGTGLCSVFIHHTSASLTINENADPSVRRDLESFLARVAPDGDPCYEHAAEGPDDMPAHIRTALTQTDLNVPVHGGELGLGTWQGIYLFEHRHHPHRRKVTVTVMGLSD